MKEYPVRAATPDHAGQGSCDLRAIDPLASFSCRLALQSGVPASEIQQSCLAVVSVTVEQSLPSLSIVSSIQARVFQLMFTALRRRKYPRICESRARPAHESGARRDDRRVAAGRE